MKPISRSNLEQTSKEAEPDKDFKLAQINEISITFSLFGALSMKQLSELTNIKINAITWRFYDDRHSEQPIWKQVGTFPIKGRRYKLFDLIERNDWIGVEYINKEFYEYLSKQEVKENMPQERFESYREKCPECNGDVWVQKSKGGNLYYTQNDFKGKNYKEQPNWHSEYCKGRPKEPEKKETATPKEEPKRSDKGTVIPSDYQETQSQDLSGADFQANRLEMNDDDIRRVEMGLKRDIASALDNFISFRIDQALKKVK